MKSDAHVEAKNRLRTVNCKQSLLAGVALTLALAGPQAVFAQTGDEEPTQGQGVEERQSERAKGDAFTPIGARVGSFQLFPAMDVDIEYGDNIYATQTGEKDDWLTRIRPELSLNSDWSNHALNFKGTGEFVRYDEYTDDDVENYDIETDARLDLYRSLTVTMGAAYGLGHGTRGDPDASSAAKSPEESVTTSANIGLAYDPNKFSSSLDLTYKDEDYDDVLNTDSTITNNDDRDKDKYELTGRLGYEYLPGTDAFIKASVNEIDYVDSTEDGGENRDSDGFSVVVGTGLAFTEIVRGDVFVGYMEQSYADASLGDVNSPTAGASVSWDATPLITVNGSLSRSITETTTSGSPAYLSTVASLSADYEILRHLTADAEVKWTRDDYEKITKEDDTFLASAGAKYLFNRNYSAGLNYSFTRKNASNSSGDSYSQQVVLMSLRGQY